MTSQPAPQDLLAGADARANLIKLLRVAYPHPQIPDGPYERTAEAILAQLDASIWHRTLLTQGLRTLDAAAGGSFGELDETAATDLLTRIANAEFFAFIRGAAVPILYGDHELWEVLGYEGESFSKGGYLNRGFDDLDWLPDPRVEEYDGDDHVVEIADQDEPKGA